MGLIALSHLVAGALPIAGEKRLKRGVGLLFHAVPVGVVDGKCSTAEGQQQHQQHQKYKSPPQSLDHGAFSEE